MIDFYDIDSDYLDYLRKYDSKVPLTGYSTYEKFFCGVVLTVGDDIPYYAPVSHFTQKQKTNFPIYDKDNTTMLSTVRLCFMIPVMPSVISRINVKELYSVDKSYAILVGKEYSYCSKNESRLREREKAVYKLGCNKRHPYNPCCCDFKILEGVYKNYNV